MSKEQKRDPALEYPDDTPVAMPVGFRHPPSLQQLIAMMTRGTIARHAEDHELESFEEANDFDVDDPIGGSEMSSPWEEGFDPHHMMTREQEIARGAVREKDRRFEEHERARGVVERTKRFFKKFGRKPNTTDEYRHLVEGIDLEPVQPSDKKA